jgi:energy-coupling factor transporter ATP-binding protein EcfA2/endogenous inhibitor of DNA gyrase (YacG/DUF329 family)
VRIEAIKLSWFRGAADKDTLDPKCKSLVVYGENASGKSSFVDAVEYVLNDGRIGHLSHEYSGKRQEKGILNTHTPEGKQTVFRIKFRDGSLLTTKIERNGTSTSSGASAVSMGSWGYQRTVLRQDEVAAFIRHRKGEKYSALLPLLGLSQMEMAAENLRQLVKSVKQESKLNETTIKLKEVETRRKDTFGTDDNHQILKKIETLFAKYCAGKATTVGPVARCSELETALETRFARFDADQKKYLTLQSAADLNLKYHIDAVRSTSDKLAGAVEPLMAEKLDVLLSAGIFVDKLGEEKEVKCPACGRSIPVVDFQAHVTAEKKRLKDIIATFNSRKVAISTLCDTSKSLKSNLDKAEMESWRNELAKGILADNLAYLDGLNAEALRTSLSEDDLKSIDENLLPLINAATSALMDAPPDVQQLSTDKKTVETGKEVIEAWGLATEAKRAKALILYLNSLEQGIRDEIRLQSQTVIDEISSDIQGMWTILHPGEAIEDVRLYPPEDTDKAIDIGLKFHGIGQDSPRLTLSEGYRNSLGLCIFLAMAKREASEDRPLFLDDVVVSLDRNHRGMIAELLEKEFGDRQVIVLTHDREWYIELRHQLQGASWNFKALMPYEKPEIGIRWSEKTWTFDDARARLESEPDSAGNIARKIMDIELAILAERLKVKMPYLHRERNDHRTAQEFLSRLISDAKKCFMIKGAEGYELYRQTLEVFQEAERLLISWANKASHSFDFARNEAQKLISVCEQALEFFKCPICKKPVYRLDSRNAEFVQCECGQLRWRYGKG